MIRKKYITKIVNLPIEWYFEPVLLIKLHIHTFFLDTAVVITITIINSFVVVIDVVVVVVIIIIVSSRISWMSADFEEDRNLNIVRGTPT